MTIDDQNNQKICGKNKSARFEAVIFDLDGTLLDTLSDLARSANQTLQELGFPEHPEKAYCYFVGDGIWQLIYRCLPENQRDDHSLVDKGVEIMTNHYARQWHNQTRPYPGVPELVDQIAVANIPQAVLSNKPDNFTRQVTDHFFPNLPFALVRGHGADFPRKPDPGGALAIARYLEVEPGRILYLGDTATDMQTAVNAGLWPVGACWGFRTRQELATNGARSLVESPAEVAGLLGLA